MPICRSKPTAHGCHLRGVRSRTWSRLRQLRLVQYAGALALCVALYALHVVAAASPVGDYVDALSSENVLEIRTDGSCYIELFGLDIGETGRWRLDGSRISLLFSDGTTIRGTTTQDAILFPSVELLSPVWVLPSKSFPSSDEVIGTYTRKDGGRDQIVIKEDGTYEKRERGLFDDDSLETGEWYLDCHVVRFVADDLFGTESDAVYLDGRLYVLYLLEFREWEQFGRRTAVTTTGTLTIAVVDADSGSPAQGIALMITGETKEMSGQTDRQGKFTCALSAGDYRVSASAPETRRVSQSVTLRTEGETRVTLKLPADPSWRRAIQVGDILYNPCTLFIGVYLGVYLGHTGIYIGGGVTADPRLDGILHPLESWDNLAEVQLLRVRCPHANPGCATAAASWAASVARRTATSYNYQVPVFGDPVFQKDPDENETEWYCSELVWAAYYNQGVDIEAPLGGQANSSSSLHYSPIFPVSPDEICEDADTFYVSGHRGGLPIEGTGERCNCRDRAKIRATCPVDLVLKDSAGRVVSKTENQIPDSVYWIDDLNYDGSPDAEIAFSPTDGVYSVTVLPWESATAMDVFTLQYFGQGGAAPITIADRHALPSTDVLSYELRIQGGVLQLPEQVTPEPTPPLPVDPGPKPPPPPPPPPVGNGGMWILLPCAVMVAAAIAAVFMSLQRRRRKRRQDEDR